MVENLCVVGTLGQSVKPHADRLVCASLPDVEVGQSLPQRAGLGAELQQRLAKSHALIQPVGQSEELLERHSRNKYRYLQTTSGRTASGGSYKENIGDHITHPSPSPVQQFVEEEEVVVKRKAGQRPLTRRQRLIRALMDGILGGKAEQL